MNSFVKRWQYRAHPNSVVGLVLYSTEARAGGGELLEASGGGNLVGVVMNFGVSMHR